MAFSTLNPKRPPIPQRSYVFRSNRFGARRVDFALCFEFSTTATFPTPPSNTTPAIAIASHGRDARTANGPRNASTRARRRAERGRTTHRRTHDLLVDQGRRARSHAHARITAQTLPGTKEAKKKRQARAIVPSEGQPRQPHNPGRSESSARQARGKIATWPRDRARSFRFFRRADFFPSRARAAAASSLSGRVKESGGRERQKVIGDDGRHRACG